LGAGPLAAEFVPGPPGLVIDLPTRPGVTLRYAAFVPDAAPRAAVILFVGGQGALNIPDQPGPNWQNPGNFLSRSRELFRRHGLYVVVVDAPSDRRQGMINNFRITSNHAADLAVVIADLRQRVPAVPIWLIGTSRGSISAANVAARLQGAQGADGVVLTSSVTRASTGAMSPSRDAIFDADLSAIRIPALVVSHRGDTCQASVPADAAVLLHKLSSAPRKEVLMFEGGDPPRSDVCEAYAAHGYLGIEERVVHAIADWILAAKS
jgi:pimeloyl-ACP methyl ester carboxylesterase